MIFDVNTFKVQQKMVGYMAHRVRSMAGAKKLFELEIDGLANFACAAGIINIRDPYKMGALKHELTQCLHPLCLTEELQRWATAPTPPPAVPIPPPAGLFSPLATPPPRPSFQYQWIPGGVSPARDDSVIVGTGEAPGSRVAPYGSLVAPLSPLGRLQCQTRM